MSERSYALEPNGHKLNLCEICGKTGVGDYILEVTEIPDGTAALLAVEHVRCRACSGLEPSPDAGRDSKEVDRV